MLSTSRRSRSSKHASNVLRVERLLARLDHSTRDLTADDGSPRGLSPEEAPAVAKLLLAMKRGEVEAFEVADPAAAALVLQVLERAPGNVRFDVPLEVEDDDEREDVW